MTTSIHPTAPSILIGDRWPAAAREAATFVGLVTLMVLGVAFAFPHAGIAPLLSMVTPLVAVVLITFLRTPRGQRRALWGTFGLRRLGLRSWPAAFVLGVTTVLLIPYGVADLLGSVSFLPFSGSAAVWFNGLTILFVNLSTMTVIALTEEIGWRSYLLPRIQALMPKRRAALVVGFVHGMFHVPLMVFTTTYNNVGSRWIVVPTVVATLTAAGVFYAWLNDRSGSVWPVAFAHSTVNTFIDGAGLVVILSPVAFAHTAGESGFVTLGAVAAAAVFLLLRGRTWGPARTVPER